MDYTILNSCNKPSSSSTPMLIPCSYPTKDTVRNEKNNKGNNNKKNNKNKGVKLSTDPQSVAARERRHRISDRFRILESLVPGGTKLDTVSMLEQTIRYVMFLKAQICLHEAIINNTNYVEANHNFDQILINTTTNMNNYNNSGTHTINDDANYYEQYSHALMGNIYNYVGQQEGATVASCGCDFCKPHQAIAVPPIEDIDLWNCLENNGQQSLYYFPGI